MITISHPLHGNFPITQIFGENAAAYAKYGLPGHNGVDWGCPFGTQVYAAADGTASRVAWDAAGYGNWIEVDHGEYLTRYAHFTATLVTVGAGVTKDTVIGLSGSTGNSTGPHLHFELRIKAEHDNGYNGAVDPLPYLAGVIPEEENPVAPIIGDRIQVLPEVGLRLRAAPSVQSDWMGLADKGDSFTVLDVKQDGNDIWVCVPVWCAARYKNENLVKKV